MASWLPLHSQGWAAHPERTRFYSAISTSMKDSWEPVHHRELTEGKTHHPISWAEWLAKMWVAGAGGRLGCLQKSSLITWSGGKCVTHARFFS